MPVDEDWLLSLTTPLLLIHMQLNLPALFARWDGALLHAHSLDAVPVRDVNVEPAQWPCHTAQRNGSSLELPVVQIVGVCWL